MTGRTDCAERLIAATANDVYAALVDPEALALWLPPAGMSGEVEVFEPHAGGAYRLVLTYLADTGTGKSSDTTDVVEGRLLELSPGRLLIQTADFHSDDPAFAGTMTMTWTLVPEEGGTLVRILCENVPTGISKEDHEVGLSSSLANLAAFLEPQRS